MTGRGGGCIPPFVKTHSENHVKREREMKITIEDLGRNPESILPAIARSESVTLYRQGRPIARIEPLRENSNRTAELPAFGMWADREDMSDPTAYVRRLRAGRSHTD